jgi:hypothetical protein
VTAGFEEIQGPVDVGFVRANRIGEGSWHTRKCRYVINDVDPLSRFSTDAWIANVGHAKIDAIGNLVEVSAESRDEIIDDSHVVAELE